MVLEEGLQSANNQINSLTGQLKRAQEKIDYTALVLQKIKAINSDLENRLDRAARIKINIDEKISDLQGLASPL